jgi:hypothetical protein
MTITKMKNNNFDIVMSIILKKNLPGFFSVVLIRIWKTIRVTAMKKGNKKGRARDTYCSGRK